LSNRRNIQFTYTPHNKATILDASFVVDTANGNGLGIRSLKGSGRIASVYMNSTYTATSAVDNSVTITNLSPSTANLKVGMGVSGTGVPVGARIASIVSSTSITITAATTGGSGTPTLTFWAAPGPNVPAGYIQVNLSDNYSRYLYGDAGFAAPVSGSALPVASSGVTLGTMYIIVSLGTTTTAGWQSLGLPMNITPAVGVSFIASKTGTATGTGAVEVIAATGAGVFSVELVGDPNQMNTNGSYTLSGAPGNTSQGMQINSACFSDSSGDVPQVTQPADNSVCGMLIYLNDSAQGV